MKIEKINENQIRCTLSKKDLADRQIKLSELAYGSEKARGLFRDMIDQAHDEFGFEADDIPLMIEAIPLSGENIVLQITKVENPEDMEEDFSDFFDEKTAAKDEFAYPVFNGVRADEMPNQTQMFQFKTIEQIERAAKILDGFYDGKNDLYKNNIKKSFSLIISKEYHTEEEFNKVCNILSEYATHNEYNAAKEAFLKEHGTLLIKANALQMLAEI